MNNQQLRDALHTNVVKVTFTKTDGSTRVMLASLQEQHINVAGQPGSRQLTHDFNQIRCVDIELGQWRSFLFSRMISAEIITAPDL